MVHMDCRIVFGRRHIVSVLSQTGMWEDIFKGFSYQFFWSCVVMGLAASRPGAAWVGWALWSLAGGRGAPHSRSLAGGPLCCRGISQLAVYNSLLFTNYLQRFSTFSATLGRSRGMCQPGLMHALSQ